MERQLGKIHNRDCVSGMNALPEGSVDLVFADPPFNIGYKYDVYEDRMAAEDYLKWSNDWIAAAHRVLKPDGTFWLAIGDDFAAELKIEAQKVGFFCRSWVIWYYTFGVNCKNKFTRSHTHLFHFVKDPQKFTFDSADLKNRVPSARMLVYNDKRAKGSGRLPDDTWIIPPGMEAGDLTVLESAVGDDIDNESGQTFCLRPQELDGSFQPSEDAWYFPRVAGTFKERAGFHGCQMPEQLLGRIVRTCSAEREVVLDPFAGSASTLIVARKLNRQFVGFELSPEYAKAGRARLAESKVGDDLVGSAEPTMDSFRKRQKASAKNQLSEQQQELVTTIERGVVESFAATHDGFSTDIVLADPEISAAFASECEDRGMPGGPRVWNRTLLRLRKRTGNLLAATSQKSTISFEECEPFLYASEIAWKILIDSERAVSLDDILCDPHLAEEFDGLAERCAPGFSSRSYRLGALRIRKAALNARKDGTTFSVAAPKRLGKKHSFGELDRLPDKSGIYLISDKSNQVFVSAALSLRDRVEQLFDAERKALWSDDPESVRVQYFRTGDKPRELLGWTSWFVSDAVRLPRFNVADLRTAT